MNENMMTDAELHAEMTHTAYNRYLRHGVVSNTLMSGSDMLPGYMLHEEFDEKLIDALRSENVIRSLCSEVTTKDDRIMPIVRGHGQPSWVPEGSTIPIVKDTFDRMVLDSHLRWISSSIWRIPSPAAWRPWRKLPLLPVME